MLFVQVVHRSRPAACDESTAREVTLAARRLTPWAMYLEFSTCRNKRRLRLCLCVAALTLHLSVCLRADIEFGRSGWRGDCGAALLIGTRQKLHATYRAELEARDARCAVYMST